MNGSSHPNDDDPATKRDIRELREEFGELRDEFGELREEFGELREEFGEFREKFSTDLRGLGVQIERLGSNLIAVIEGQQSRGEALSRTFSFADAQLAVRVGDLEDVVSRHSGDLATMRADVAHLRAALERDASPHPDLERRVAALEAELASR